MGFRVCGPSLGLISLDDAVAPAVRVAHRLRQAELGHMLTAGATMRGHANRSAAIVLFKPLSPISPEKSLRPCTLNPKPSSLNPKP